MRILIFHGYLLGGTGSNVYNARLAAALVRLGHEVHLLCQDRHPEALPFVDATGDWDAGSLKLATLHKGPVRCTVYRPDIGGLLPVYVQDSYEGLEARTFAACSDGEVHSYLTANVEAVRQVAALVKPEIALANHLVMGPAILARGLEGQVPYAVKVHGSALEYTVKPEPERFLPFAREGIAGARAVLVGSRHTAESLWEALGAGWMRQDELRARTRLGPPGVDVHTFGPREPEQASAGLRSLITKLGSPPMTEIGDQAAERPGWPRAARPGAALPGGQAPAVAAAGDGFARDDARAGRALLGLDAADGPIVVYVGKLIVSKGVDLLLAAWPLVLEQVPAARLVIVGFGAFQDGLEALASALAAGNLQAAHEIAQAGRELEGGPRARLGHLQAFLETLQDDDGGEHYLRAAATLPGSAAFTGRLDHEELVDLLPACEATVVPSTFPEAFGMVAVEAAACGVLPISAGHSGLAEVSRRLAAAIGEPAAEWLSFPVDDRAVQAIAERLTSWLTVSKQTQARTREAMVATVRRLWSWEGVAENVIAAATGRLENLSAP